MAWVRQNSSRSRWNEESLIPGNTSHPMQNTLLPPSIMWRGILSAIISLGLIGTILCKRLSQTSTVALSTNSLSNSLLPQNKQLITNTLSNGLTYHLLPSKHQYFAAHLEILAGSADEDEGQRGMAHLVEHLAFPSPGRVPGQEIKSNALTDFHHTVFFLLDCHNSALPQVCDWFAGILSEPVSDYSADQIEAEKLAILSEMRMIDTAEYQTVTQTFGSLHSENILSHRFPIGVEEQIRSWTPDQLREFCKRHYRPENAHLYLSGNFDPNLAEKLIREKLGSLPAMGAPEEGSVTLKATNSHFPPVRHQWTGPRDRIEEDLQKRFSQKRSGNWSETVRILAQSNATGPSVRIFPTLAPDCQEATIQIFAKRPLPPISTRSEFERDLARTLVTKIFQMRFCHSPPPSQDPIFNPHRLRRLSQASRLGPHFSADFQTEGSVKEGCLISGFSVKSLATEWQAALELLLQEARSGLLESLLISPH
jgi:hypothetical protein